MPAHSSLDPDELADRPDADGRARLPPGHDTRTLGPSDSSDSGSDVAGADAALGDAMRSDTDASGTGEDTAADGPADTGRDISADRVVDADEAGLGRGLDEAEAAQVDPAGRRDGQPKRR